ncbi:MAG: carboxypeptidase-like regulatory domain-containing protein [Minicystis sp.]
MSLSRAFLAPALAAALVSITSSTALAGPSPKEKAEARQLVTDAKKAMKDHRYGDAVGALKKASSLDPSTATDLELAQAEIGAGKLVEASKLLAKIEGDSDATPAGKKAKESAKKLLGELRPRIPTVKITVKGPTGKANVTLDGLEVDAAGEISVDPGDHNVGASADGFKAQEKPVKLAEGAHESVEIALESNAPVVKEEAHGLRLPGIIVTSVGGAALVVGGVFGGLAFSATSDAKKGCVNNLCPNTQAQRDRISKAKLFGNVSTGMLIAGGAVAATGVVLTILAPGGGSSKKDDAPKSARVIPWVGADQVGVAGTF